MIVAVDCNDRLFAALRSSSISAVGYGCESCHKGHIVAGHKRQNENKSLQDKKIWQTKKQPHPAHGLGLSKSIDSPGFPGETNPHSGAAWAQNERMVAQKRLNMAIGLMPNAERKQSMEARLA
jgi:hypothetical protein